MRNPRGVPNIRPGLNYAHTPVDFAYGPNQAASIGHYKTTGKPGPYAGSVPVGSLGPNQAAAIGRYMAGHRNREIRSRSGGRFDQIGARGFGKRNPGPARGSGGSRGPGGWSIPLPAAMQPVVAPQEDPRIRRMTNKAVNQAFINADPRAAQKQFMGRGLSLDKGTLAAAMPRISEAFGNAAYSSMVQPLFHYLDDQAYALQQQRNNVQKLSPLLALLQR